jgi:hypothetical protein
LETAKPTAGTKGKTSKRFASKVVPSVVANPELFEGEELEPFEDEEFKDVIKSIVEEDESPEDCKNDQGAKKAFSRKASPSPDGID